VRPAALSAATVAAASFCSDAVLYEEVDVLSVSSGSPPPTRTIRLPSASTTRVAKVRSGPRASRAAIVVKSFIVEAGVSGVPDERSASTRPSVVVTTTPTFWMPFVETFFSRAARTAGSGNGASSASGTASGATTGTDAGRASGAARGAACGTTASDGAAPGPQSTTSPAATVPPSQRRA